MPKSPSLVLAYSAEQYTPKKGSEARNTHKTIATQEGYSLFTQANSANWYVRFSVNQKQFKKSLKTDNLEEAKRRAMKVYFETTAKAEVGLRVHATTVNDALNEWLQTGKLRQPEQSVVDRFVRGYFGRMDVSKLTSRTLADFMEWRRTYWTEGPGRDIDYVVYERNGRKVKRPIEHTEPQPSTVNTLQAIISKFFRFCLNRHYIRTIPEFERVKVKARVRPSFTDKEIMLLQQEALNDVHKFSGTRHILEAHDANVAFAFITVMLGTGLRPTECLRLKWRDIVGFDPDMPNSRIDKVRLLVWGKGKSRPMAPLDSAVIALRTLWHVYTHTCHRLPTEDDFVWSHRNMNQYKDVTRLVDKLLKRLKMKEDYKGDKRDSYSFRHYYITDQLNSRVSISSIAQNCGTSVKMIERHYSHQTIEDIADEVRPTHTRL